MAAESASYSRKINVWRRQERDDGSVIENNGTCAKMTELSGFFVDATEFIAGMTDLGLKIAEMADFGWKFRIFGQERRILGGQWWIIEQKLRIFYREYGFFYRT